MARNRYEETKLQEARAAMSVDNYRRSKLNMSKAVQDSRLSTEIDLKGKASEDIEALA